jgi:hypothetical protein
VRIRVFVALAVFAYLTILRTWRISEIFGMLGDQVLYWNIALRPWRDLPLGGGPSSVGGTTLGPAFMWTMWGIRLVVGPWTDNLPHAGGIGLSVIQSIADVVLLIGLWKRFESLVLALAMALLVATTPEEMSLSASIWNPPLAVAFVKIAIALVLLGDRNKTLLAGAAATASAVLAVQCHSSAVFVAAPVIASFPLREWLARRPRRALASAGAAAAIVLFLEIPFLLDLGTTGREPTPGAVMGDVSQVLRDPAALRPAAALQAVVAASEHILLLPWTAGWLGVFLVFCTAVAAYRVRDNVLLAGITVVPLTAVVVGFSFWQRTFEHYWFLTMMPSVALTVGLALTAWRPAAPILAASLLLIVLAAQPARFAQSMIINRFPEYGALARGSKEIRRRVSEVRRIDIEFAVPISTNTHFIYERILGGQVTPTAPFVATIERTGHVRFTPAE